MSSTQSKFVQVGELRIHYLCVGDDVDLPPLVFLHGWPTNAALYRNIMPGLSTQRRVIAVDFPGFGQSENPKKFRYTFRFFDQFLTDLFGSLNIDDVGLVVHDLGGPIGLHWAIDNPQRLRELIVLNTLAYPNLHWASVLFVLAMELPIVNKRLSSPEGIEWVMRLGVHDKEVITEEIASLYSDPYQDPLAQHLLRKAGREPSLGGLRHIARGLNRLADVPTTMIVGEDDRILPNAAKTMTRLQKVWPSAQITALPDAGHFLQEDSPEEITRLIGDFLGEQAR